MIPKVTVIVLVYKAEKYIERCVRSLFEQTLQEMEYVFVDDGTPDNSMEVLRKVMEEFPYRKSAIKIVTNDRNRGTAFSRNNGLRASEGEYVIYCDSDDYVEKDMYETLYTRACSENADIVMCDYYEELTDRRRHVSQNPFLCKEDIISQMLVGRIHSSVCGALIKRELFDANQIEFPVGISMWEDMATSVKLHHYAKKVGYVDRALYHYVMNDSSLVHKETMKNVEDRIRVVSEIRKFLIRENCLAQFDSPIACAMLNAKMSLLLDSSLRDFDRWRSLFPEAGRYIWTYQGSLFRRFAMFLVVNKWDKMVEWVLWMKRIGESWK